MGACWAGTCLTGICLADGEADTLPASPVSLDSSSASGIPNRGKLLYEADFSSAQSVSDWVMEGDALVAFSDGWMEMYSPDETSHHVFWCSATLPNSFIAQWQAQNLYVEAGLNIVFFAATGLQGQDIFDEALPERDGTFKQYTEGSIRSYHISYYANAEHNPNRKTTNLRKNNSFMLLQQGLVGIPAHSTDVHLVTLIKQESRIRLYVDERKVIDYRDDKPIIAFTGFTF